MSRGPRSSVVAWALFLAALPGCLSSDAPRPAPWDLRATTATIAPGEWASHHYQAEPHVLSITVKVNEGPPVSVVTLSQRDYERFARGESYEFERACTHGPMTNGTISCALLDPGDFAFLILNGSGPDGDAPPIVRGPANITYSSGGARVSS